jgi:hypothetical protein
MNETKLTGREAMDAWNKTFQMHKIPKWLNRKIKAYYILKDGTNHANQFFFDRITSGYGYTVSYQPLFDHWGSVTIHGVPVFMTQPYGRHDYEAFHFADAFNLNISINCGVWNEGTIMYCFWEKKYGDLMLILND